MIDTICVNLFQDGAIDALIKALAYAGAFFVPALMFAAVPLQNIITAL
jgi:hypothetical protein